MFFFPATASDFLDFGGSLHATVEVSQSGIDLQQHFIPTAKKVRYFVVLGFEDGDF
jgi:hypothetical protein